MRFLPDAAQAILFGMNAKMTLAWIISGLPWDIVHGVGNLFAGMLIVPFCTLLEKLAKRARML